MSNRPSRIVLMFRMFCTLFVIVFLISLFWNTLSGRDMFPIAIVFWVSVVLTIWFTIAGWVGVEKKIDVCWNCNYGADGDSTAYRQRFPNG
jgi:hypothetical protein